MLLKELITELTALYEEESKHIDVMGEPTIEIDCFTAVEGTPYFQYVGFGHEIAIERSNDGVYNILSRFGK